jgi:hypothetical protein
MVDILQRNKFVSDDADEAGREAEMTVHKELVEAEFLATLTRQGFNTRYIAPYLKTIIYDEFANEVEYPTEEGSIRFEVHYPEMVPICQYCGWVAGQLETRDEWFVPGDRIFHYDEKKTLTSFYAAFKFAATTAMLNRLDIPTSSPPWYLEGWKPPMEVEPE